MRPDRSRERPEKILVAMNRLADGTTRFLKYEDIVVRAFEMFPDEFALRGYPQYPDSSDIHKPLYGILKRRGLVRAASKTFALTTHGREVAQRLEGKAGAALDEARSPDRMERDVRIEVDRMVGSMAFRLFSEGTTDKILDTDFYQFLGCTVRTPKNDFLGRMNATAKAIEVAVKLGQPTPIAATNLANAWAALRKRFAGIIERRHGRN